MKRRVNTQIIGILNEKIMTGSLQQSQDSSRVPSSFLSKSHMTMIYNNKNHSKRLEHCRILKYIITATNAKAISITNRRNNYT